MKTTTDIEQDLDQLVQSHYYSEDYELEWAAKNYYDQLAPEEQDHMAAVLLTRLSGDASLSDVTIATRLGLSSLTPSLASLLNREGSSSAMSRAILVALSHQPDERAYEAVERFMDSDQEGEALVCLCRMNFQRALPHFRWALQKNHLHNFCLHALHEVKLEAGLDRVKKMVELILESDRNALAPHLKKIIHSKSGSFNPFSIDELEALTVLLI